MVEQVWTSISLLKLRHVARRCAKYAIQNGGLFLLEGPLGAGKTTFSRLFCRAMGYKGRINSPTFQLIHYYEGGGRPIYHLDLYRLNSVQAALELDILPDLLLPGVVALVEWPSYLAAALGPGVIWIRFSRQPEDFSCRTLRIEGLT